MAAALALFLLDLLPWDAVRALPWESLFLLGGGVALSTAARDSGLAAALGDAALRGRGRARTAAAAVALATALSNGVSNVATANILLPLVACVVSGLYRYQARA